MQGMVTNETLANTQEDVRTISVKEEFVQSIRDVPAKSRKEEFV